MIVRALPALESAALRLAGDTVQPESIVASCDEFR